MAVLFLANAAVLVFVLHGSLLYGASYAVIGLLCLIMHRMVQHAYRRGYMRYLGEVGARLNEARARGMSCNDWYTSEIERTTGITRIPRYDDL